MTENTAPVLELSTLRLGDRVTIQTPGWPSSSGLVEGSMPALGVIWIRDLSTGERRMLSTDEHRIIGG